LVWEGHLVVGSASALTLFSQDGKRLWARTKQSKSAFAAGNGLLYYENTKCNLDAVNTENELSLDGVPLPSAMNAEFQVRLLWPRDEDFISVVVWPGRPPHQSPQVIRDRTRFGQALSARDAAHREWLRLPPIYIPETDRLVLCTDNVTCADAETAKEVSRFELPLDQPIDWSANAKGALCISGYSNGAKTLVSVSLTGDEEWRWTDPENEDRWPGDQPPIRGRKKRIYALTESRVLGIEMGRIVWQHEVEDGTVRHGSSLADGSVLVAAGKNLLHLSAKGRVLFSVDVGDEILCPPVVDAQGNVYVATASTLVQIR